MPNIVIETGLSSLGWGVCFGDLRIEGRWSQTERFLPGVDRQISYQSSPCNGQQDIRRVHKQNGGHFLVHSRIIYLSNMAEVSQQRHNNICATPTRVS